MYEHEYEAMFGLEDVYWWFIARRQLAVEILRRELASRPDARILDVGCGTGSNLSAFAQLEHLPFADATFDVVTAMDVLEHTDDDLEALEELRRVCKPGGLLLATVPAYGFLWSEHDEALKHRRRYTAHELRNKLTVTDFAVERTSYFITTLFVPILLMRIHQGLFKKSTHPQTSIQVLPPWLNRTLVGLLSIERRVFRSINLPFGVSIVAQARPSERRRIPATSAAGLLAR
jgi:SAM-dependent methyltransferase